MTGPGAGAPTHRRGAAVEQNVLETTLALLAERGYEFSVDEVAARAGVHKTTIYRRWETKPALVAAAITLLAEQQVTVATTGDHLHDLTDLAVGVARALRQAAGVNALRAALSTAGVDPDLQSTAAAFLGSRYAVATDIIVAAQRVGLLRRELDPRLLWQAIVNPLHLNAVTGGPIDDRTAAALVDLVLNGARPPGRRA